MQALFSSDGRECAGVLLFRQLYRFRDRVGAAGRMPVCADQTPVLHSGEAACESGAAGLSGAVFCGAFLSL